MSLINQAVLAQCAGHDGGVATDAFLTDPRRCHFDPQVLQCTGCNVPPACLTADQVTTMQNYYAGTIDQVTGKLIVPGFVLGSETEDLGAEGLMLKEQLPEPLFDGPMYWVFGSSFGQPGSGAVNYDNFDIHRDLPAVNDALAGPLNADSADLSAFQAHGGKLIMYHGWADPLLSSQSSINYFHALVERSRHDVVPAQPPAGSGETQTAAQTALQRTQSYALLYMVPGMYHCSGGPGPNSFAFLPSLEDWVENGTVPGPVVATKFVNDIAPNVQMTRPLCVFPKIATYNGSGSTDDAANFTCVDQGHADPTPAR